MLNNKMPWPAYAQNQGSMMPMNMPGNATMPNMMPGAMMPGSMVQGAMTPPPITGVPITPSGVALPGVPTQEESYVENILRMNLGKVATLYMTYENNSEWNAKIFKGVLEAAGRDHIIISDPATGKRYLLLMLNLDYITFDGPINYALPFGSNR
ncbi:spore coat protein GerQ [Cohnella boryungensis]|uniref:Spore coat protein GerQ n=1 Tax=Cohnella boryungensis TaxID=768479 RepID=A0ABV8SA30_9BACL